MHLGYFEHDGIRCNTLSRPSSPASNQREFFEAIKIADVDKVKKILPFIEDINAQDHLERTVMHLAVTRTSLFKKRNSSDDKVDERKQIVELLLNHELRPGLNIKNKSGNTVKMLLDRDDHPSTGIDQVFAEGCKRLIFPEQVAVQL